MPTIYKDAGRQLDARTRLSELWFAWSDSKPCGLQMGSRRAWRSKGTAELCSFTNPHSPFRVRFNQNPEEQCKIFLKIFCL